MSWFVQNINSWIYINELYDTNVSTNIDFFDNVFDAITFYKKKCKEALKFNSIVEDDSDDYIKKCETTEGNNKICTIINKKNDNGYRAIITIGPCQENNSLSEYLSLGV